MKLGRNLSWKRQLCDSVLQGHPSGSSFDWNMASCRCDNSGYLFHHVPVKVSLLNHCIIGKMLHVA